MLHTETWLHNTALRLTVIDGFIYIAPDIGFLSSNSISQTKAMADILERGVRINANDQ